MLPVDNAYSPDGGERVETHVVCPLESKEDESSGSTTDWDPAEEMAQGVLSDDPSLQLSSLEWFKIELTKPAEHIAKADWMVKRSVVPRFVTFLKSEDAQMQLAAAWVLTNIAVGTDAHVDALLNAHALPSLTTLLTSSVLDVRMQAIWAIGNIAGHSSECRDLVVFSTSIARLLKVFSEELDPKDLRTATWALLSLCSKGRRSIPDRDLILHSLSTWLKLVDSEDEEVASDASYAIASLSDGPRRYVQYIVRSGVCPRLVDLFKHNSPNVQADALRSIGNIASEGHRKMVLGLGVLPALSAPISSPVKNVQTTACWAVSHFLRGTSGNIQAVIDENLMQPLIRHLRDGTTSVKQMACLGIVNAACYGTRDQVLYLVSEGCVGPLCNMLDPVDPKYTMAALDGLRCILKAGKEELNHWDTEAVNECAVIIEKVGAMPAILQLRYNEDLSVFRDAKYLANTYLFEL